MRKITDKAEAKVDWCVAPDAHRAVAKFGEVLCHTLAQVRVSKNRHGNQIFDSKTMNSVSVILVFWANTSLFYKLSLGKYSSLHNWGKGKRCWNIRTDAVFCNPKYCFPLSIY